MTGLRLLTRAAPLAALAVAGFLLGSCGGGDSALTTGTGLTATRPARTETGPVVTRTTPTLTAPTRTNESPTEPEPSTTESVTTTVTEPSEPPVTEPPSTVTTVETETTLIPIPTATATTTEPASSTDDTPWGWIALALALAGLAVLGLVLWRRRHTQAASWGRRLDDLSRRSLVTGGVQTLADEARSLESSAPDDHSSSAAAALRLRLDDLAAALEADRKLRLGSTPPSEEQLAYSTSLVHHEVEQLQSHLRAGASSSA